MYGENNAEGFVVELESGRVWHRIRGNISNH